MPLARTHHRQRPWGQFLQPWMTRAQQRFATFGGTLPKALADELGALEPRLG